MKLNIPKRYVPKTLSKRDKARQKKMIQKSRKDYKKKIYKTRKKVDSFKSKKSQHIINAEKIYNLKKITVNSNLAKKTGCSVNALNSIIKKGQGAYYSSGSRPNQTAHSWGVARLASSITGGKASVIDYNILESGCSKQSRALSLAKKARKKHGKTTRKVAKI